MHEALHDEIRRHLAKWHGGVRPSRQQLLDAAAAVTAFRQDRGIVGLWEAPPLMATATLDDAFGHGLDLIHRFAVAAGLRLLPLGTLRPAGAVVAACRAHRPELLGLTVLQFDTEADLLAIRAGIPEETCIVAGGPVFAADPDLARRAGIGFVARNAGAFWQFLLAMESLTADER